MKRWIWLSLAVLVLLSACATYSGYQTREVETPSYITDFPGSWYNYDPSMRYWYTAPYWNPDVGP
jgi:hypothetical protein